MKVNIIDKKVVFDDFYKIEEATFEFEKPDGVMSAPVSRLCFERGDSVAGIVFNTTKQEVILVRQFRYPTYADGQGWIIEVVAGMLSKGEEPELAMKREVLEEVGYRATHINHISTFYVSPGGSSERIFLYYIEVDEESKVHEGGGLEHENEYIEIVKYSLDELQLAIEEGNIPDAKSIIPANYMLSRYV